MSLIIKAARAGSQGGLAGNVQQGGLLGDIFGGIKGAVTGGVSSLIRGGNPLVGAISGGVRGIRGTPRTPPVPSLPGGVPSFPAGPSFGPGGTGMVRAGGGKGGSFAVSPAGTKIACPAGHRPNKTDYFLKDGSFVPAGSRCVKIRRQNPLNPRALSRSIRRIEGGKRAAKRLSRISIRKKC